MVSKNFLTQQKRNQNHIIHISIINKKKPLKSAAFFYYIHFHPDLTLIVL